MSFVIDFTIKISQGWSFYSKETCRIPSHFHLVLLFKHILKRWYRTVKLLSYYPLTNISLKGKKTQDISINIPGEFGVFTFAITYNT